MPFVVVHHRENGAPSLEVMHISTKLVYIVCQLTKRILCTLDEEQRFDRERLASAENSWVRRKLRPSASGQDFTVLSKRLKYSVRR